MPCQGFAPRTGPGNLIETNVALALRQRCDASQRAGRRACHRSLRGCFLALQTIPGYYKRLDPPDAVLLRKRLQGETSSSGAANGTDA